MLAGLADREKATVNDCVSPSKTPSSVTLHYRVGSPAWMYVVYGWMDLELSIVKAGVAHLQSTPSRSTDGEVVRSEGDEQNNQKNKRQKRFDRLISIQQTALDDLYVYFLGLLHPSALLFCIIGSIIYNLIHIRLHLANQMRLYILL
jgi:hypothetical protein